MRSRARNGVFWSLIFVVSLVAAAVEDFHGYRWAMAVWVLGMSVAFEVGVYLGDRWGW